MNSSLVEEHFSRSDDPTLEARIVVLFGTRYAYLKSQQLTPGEVMGSLFDLLTGIGHVQPRQQVAAQALLAHLFDSCHIFERDPQGVDQ